MSRESSSSPWTSKTRANSISHAKIFTGDLPPPYNMSACNTESEGKEPAAISTSSGQAKSSFFASLWRRIVLRHAPASVRRRALKQDPWLPISPSCTLPAPDKEEKLQRYLIEILGFTFGVNFDEVNTAYYSRTVSKKTTSLLGTTEQAELLHISRTIDDLLKEQSRNALSTVPRAPKQEIYNNVIIPAFLSLEAYTIDLLATYAHHQCNPCFWNHTCASHRCDIAKREGAASVGEGVGEMSGIDGVESEEGICTFWAYERKGYSSGNCVEESCWEGRWVWEKVVMCTGSDARSSSLKRIKCKRISDEQNS
jgi:hypothetical protein